MTVHTLCHILRAFDSLSVEYRTDAIEVAETRIWQLLARLRPDTKEETFSIYRECYFKDDKKSFKMDRDCIVQEDGKPLMYINS